MLYQFAVVVFSFTLVLALGHTYRHHEAVSVDKASDALLRLTYFLDCLSMNQKGHFPFCSLLIKIASNTDFSKNLLPVIYAILSSSEE